MKPILALMLVSVAFMIAEASEELPESGYQKMLKELGFAPMSTWIITPSFEVAKDSEEPKKVVPASDVLVKIQKDEPVEYNHVIITGDLDLSKLNLSTKHANRSYDEMDLGLSENNKIVRSKIRINDSVIDGKVNFGDIIWENSTNFMDTVFNSYANFEGSSFTHTAYFKGSTFNGPASFIGSKFNRHADFGESTFNITSTAGLI